VIYFSRSNNNPRWNGGDKRTAQLCEVLSQFKYEFVALADVDLPHKDGMKKILGNPSGFFKERLLIFVKQYLTYNKYLQWNERFRENIVKSHTLSKVFVKALANNKPDLLIIDDPVFLTPVVHYAKANNIPLVAFCQNIESLSREQVVSSFQQDLFHYELKLIAQCDLVVTISREETFLLRNFGIDPLYLPYYPIKTTLEGLLKVRNERQQSNKSDFLLLGTVSNLATLEGMKKVILAICSNGILQRDRLIIVGYGTREKIAQTDDPRIEVRGDLSEVELLNLLTTVKGCIVYQDSGSGALTKIPELLAAGVPVIINTHAARSHHDLPGIFEFETLEGLGKQMDAAAKSDLFPQVLSPPDTSLMLTRLFSLIN
jgi:hypothetical protein